MRYNDITGKYGFNGGTDVILFQTIAKHLNISYEVLYCNQVWGTQPLNGTWDGIVGKLVSKVINDI